MFNSFWNKGKCISVWLMTDVCYCFQYGTPYDAVRIDKFDSEEIKQNKKKVMYFLKVNSFVWI